MPTHACTDSHHDTGVGRMPASLRIGRGSATKSCNPTVCDRSRERASRPGRQLPVVIEPSEDCLTCLDPSDQDTEMDQSLFWVRS
jgi:hypothetical protein